MARSTSSRARPRRPPFLADPTRVAVFRRRLLEHWERTARPLPWREHPDPYGILVSEFMLQQTRVDTVVPYYHAWMQRFPNVEALAEAPVDDVLVVWRGLGYYGRARRLHAAARAIVEFHGGAVPAEEGVLRSLPGVGPYTAGAVASIAWGRPVPAVDGNVHRVLSRLADEPDPSPSLERDWAGRLVDPARPGDFNQAFMELGALVCLPVSPRCGECPVAEFCAARAAGTQEERPRPRTRGPVARRAEAVLVLAHRGARGAVRVLLRQRPMQGLLGGMWEFPGIEVSSDEAPERVVLELLSGLQVEPAGADRKVRTTREPLAPDPLPSFEHLFSHLRIRYLPFVTWWPTGAPLPALPDRYGWMDLDESSHWALPRAQQRILADLETAASQVTSPDATLPDSKEE